MGRATQGVRLINLKENDIIASVAIVFVSEEETDPEISAEEQNFQDEKEIGKEFDD
jgi:hypothetical protein